MAGHEFPWDMTQSLGLASPPSHQEFAAHLDAYEREHFAYSPGGRAVSDSTLALLLGFYPRPLHPLLRRSTLALLDPAPRNSTVVTTSPTTLAVIDVRVFRALLRDVPAMSDKLLAGLARRLREADLGD